MGLTIACVENSNYQGCGRQYVNNLHGMVRRNITVPFRFVCITDNTADLSAGIETQPSGDLKSWWAKLLLFKKGTFPDGERVIYFDLDTLILANIDDIADWRGPLACLGNWRTGGWPISSAMMAWTVGKDYDIWDKWEAAGRPITRWGDDEWLRAMRSTGTPGFQNLFRGLVSYKFHKCRNGLPDGTRIVAFCQQPKPHQLTSIGWVAQAWQPVN